MSKAHIGVMLIALALGCESIADIRDYRRAPDAAPGSTSDAAGGQSGGDAAPAQCATHLAACQSNISCCGYPSAQCFKFNDGVSRCSSACESNKACASGCCLLVFGRRGACGNANECSPLCRVAGETCDSHDNCCDNQLCVEFRSGEPSECRPRCTDDVLCASGCCRPIETGARVCFPKDVACPAP